jgi:hypothetical protein
MTSRFQCISRLIKVTQHPMFSLYRFNIHIFVRSVLFSSFSIFCDAVSSVSSLFYIPFISELLHVSKAYTYWMDSPAVGLAALCPLDLRNQNQHCDVRHKHGTEIKTSTFLYVLMRAPSFQLHVLSALGLSLVNSAFSSNKRFVEYIMCIFNISTVFMQ